MTPSSRADQSKRKLSQQAHEQTIELIRLAEKSEHPEIRRTALELAKETSKYHQKQSARVPPTLILSVVILLGIVVVGVAWYASVHYSEQKAHQVYSIAVLVYLVIVGVCLFLSGYLSQANFMKILGWLPSHIKAGWNLLFKKSADSDPQD